MTTPNPLKADERNRDRARGVLRELGLNGLKLSAECARANAAIRYWRGEVDWANYLIDRALAYEQLAHEVEYGRRHIR